MKKIELLAPAGDLQRAKVAITFGADAVYLGGKRFSLRSRASNFDLEDIREACAFAKQHGAHIHVTVNMIPHNEDFDGLEEYLKQLEEMGVTAVIVASLSIVKTVKQVAPKLEVHLSTQMSVTNHKAMEFYRRFGVDRVVLARECTLEEVKTMSIQSDIPMEAFIHGGMCVNVSGRCTLSNAMTLRDANRGGCAQSCRWKYHLVDETHTLSDEEKLFSMSSKDLVAYDVIEDLIKAGIVSLKIEGRMKSAYYIATLIKTYRMLIDEVYEKGHLTQDRLDFYRQELNKAVNRPTCSGFYHGLPQKESHLYGINGEGVTHDFVAIVQQVDSANQRVILQSRNVFSVGDTLEVFGPHLFNERFVVEEIFDDQGESIFTSNKPMTSVQVTIPFEVEVGDMIRRIHA